jgi:hypothetical protein
MREFPLVVSPNIIRTPRREASLCLNVRFWTESFEIPRSQRCDAFGRDDGHCQQLEKSIAPGRSPVYR